MLKDKKVTTAIFCFAYGNGECTILNTNDCGGCKFFKTKTEFEKGFKLSRGANSDFEVIEDEN